MFKRILISLLSVLIVLISITGVFRYFVNICNDYLLPEKGRVTAADIAGAESKTVDYFFATEHQSIGVIGKNLKDNRLYYVFYANDGKVLAGGNFGKSIEDCIIHDIRVVDNTVNVLCLNDGVSVMYSIDFSQKNAGNAVKLAEKISFTPNLGNDTLSKLLLPDSNGEYILAAGTQKAVLYDTKGQIIRSYAYSTKSVITSGVYHNGELILCGADSASEDGVGFSYGFAEAFDVYGEHKWSEVIYDEVNCVSAVTECQINKDGNLALYGRFYDYSKSDVIMTTLDVRRIDEFKIYGHGCNYYIYTKGMQNDDGDIVRSSVFLAELDIQGIEKEMTVYSALNDYRVPSLAREKSLNKLNNKGEFILTLAQATDSSDDSYYLTVDGTTVEIPCHLSVYYDIDNKGGIYTYIAENSVGVYKMVYFSSVEDFSVAMSKLSRALYFSELLDYVPDILPWILISAVGIILIMAKHKWRNIDAE